MICTMLPINDQRTVKQILEEDGYVIVDGLVPPEFFSASDRGVRSSGAEGSHGEWKFHRVVGVPFPPWNETGEDFWGVQHLLHPDLGEPIFAQWYSSENLLAVVKELLLVTEEELILQLVNLLINPIHSDYSLPWHRNRIELDADAEEEARCLKIPYYGVQWNTALYDDNCLFVVPRSHLRLLTSEERDAVLYHPYSNENMLGAICVKLRAGQTVFYNNNILHRGDYSKESKRITIHASMGAIMCGNLYAEKIMEHGLEWIRDQRLVDMLPDRLLPLHHNLIRLAYP